MNRFSPLASSRQAEFRAGTAMFREPDVGEDRKGWRADIANLSDASILPT